MLEQAISKKEDKARAIRTKPNSKGPSAYELYQAHKSPRALRLPKEQGLSASITLPVAEPTWNRFRQESATGLVKKASTGRSPAIRRWAEAVAPRRTLGRRGDGRHPGCG
jgi:hypothetical protein